MAGFAKALLAFLLRARLKKDYEDFKKHPEYDSFVREEWVEDDRDGVVAKDGHSSDNPKTTERAEKLDQVLKRDAVKTGLYMEPCTYDTLMCSTNKPV